MSQPLRIGLLGASRIAEKAVTEATRVTGDVRAAVAARDPERARAYAREHGYDDVHIDYGSLIADPSLDLIYVGLPNGLHATWAARALEAGKSVLLEKPFAANVAEFDRVVSRLDAAPGWVWEAFHYAHHPLMERMIDLVVSGEVGDVREVMVHMDMPAPAASDPRWNFDLAGGAMMDLGCYAVHGLLLLSDALSMPLTLTSAIADPYEHDDRIDATVRAQLSLGTAPVTLRTSMVSPHWDFSLQITGSSGVLTAPSYVLPNQDDRVIIQTPEGVHEEHLGTEASYVYQLRTIRERLRSGERSQEDLARSRRTAEFVDEIYLVAGLPLRPAQLRD